MADLSGPNPDEVNGLDSRGVAITAKPVLVGARGSTATPSTVSDGQAVDIWADVRGVLQVALRDTSGAAVTVTSSRLQVDIASNAPINVAQIGGATVPAAAAPGDAETNAQNMANDQAFLMAYNGTSWDRLRTIPSLDAAPNTNTGILSAGIGPGFDLKTNPAGVAATSTANAVTVVVDGADVIALHVTTIGTTPGSMIIETTDDDANWTTAGAVLKLGAEQWVNGSFVPAVNDVYLVRTTGLRQVRYRVNATYASGTATVKVTASVGAAIVKAMDVGPAPHSMGYSILSASQQFTTTQTSTNLIAGTAGKRIFVVGLEISTGGTISGRASIYWGTGAFTMGTSPTLFDGEFAPSGTVRPGAIVPFPWVPGASSATGDNLRLTTSTGMTIYVTVHYYLA